MEATTRESAFLIEKLISLTLNPLRKEGVHTDAAARRILSQSLRLLGSRLASPDTQDESLALQTLRRKFQHFGLNQQVSRVEDLQLRLVVAGTPPETRIAFFTLLTALPSTRDVQSASLPQLAPFRNSALYSASHCWSSAKDTTDPKQQQQQQSMLKAAGAPLPPRLANGHGPLRNDISVGQGGLSALGEVALVREVLCACQGFDGRHVRFNPAAMRGSGGFDIAPEAGVPPVQRHLMLKLCELGWLFRKMQEHVKEAGMQEGESAIRQAFKAALQRELSSLYQLMAQLDALAGHPLPAGEDTGAPYLTLRRLAVWVAEPLQRLRTLAALADAVEGLEGSRLISALDAATKHGEPAVSATIERCLRDAYTPMLDMIRSWLFEGRLKNAEGDFFITASPHSKASFGALWRTGFILEEDIVPPLVSRPLANKLLRSGKTLNFLRECCGDSEFEQGLTRTPLATAASEISYGQTEELERVVESTAASIDHHVITTLLNKYNIVAHCHAIKQYLLLSRGDFVAALMESLGAELERPAKEITEYGLTGFLDAAVRASSAQYDDPDLIARLRIRLDQATGSETGWDVFTLRYTVEEPLATVVTDAALAQYHSVARLLWALKRAEHALSASWLLLNGMERSLSRMEASARSSRLSPPGTKAVWNQLKRYHSVRNKMAHLCGNLQAYLMFEVLERAWTQFNARLANVSDLDSLIGAHDQYLEAMVKGCLLGEEDFELQRELGLLLSALMRMLPQLCRLNFLVEGAGMELGTRMRLMEDRSRASRWATIETDKPLRGIPEEDVREVDEGLKSVITDYESRLRNFVALLPAKTPVDLNFLLFRLDSAVVA